MEWHTANFKTDEKVDKFIDMFSKFNTKEKNKFTFSFKILVDISNAWDALLMFSIFISFSAWPSVTVLKKKWFLQLRLRFDAKMI